KKFEIREHGDFRDITQIIKVREWGTLVDPPRHLDYDVIREFYVNALPSDEDPFTFIIMVRGRTIHLNRNAIIEYLGNPLTLRDDELCAYTIHLNRTWNIEDNSRSILLKGLSVHLNMSGDTSYLFYYILEGRQVDVDRVIDNELKMIAKSGHKAEAKPTFPLVFPSLIMGLYIAARLVILAQVNATISGPINDTCVSRPYLTLSQAIEPNLLKRSYKVGVVEFNMFSFRTLTRMR
ncbi:hypothetical protein RYX36_003713, partial [Vicia faba]